MIELIRVREILMLILFYSVYGGGCFYDTNAISTGQVFLNEVFASFTVLFLAYGVGLDPRQALLFGPRLGPLLVGSSVGLVSFATSGIVPGYAGAQLNPARCFAFGIARRDLSSMFILTLLTFIISRLINDRKDQWIWWFGPAIAGLLLAVIYNAIPPHLHDKEKGPPHPHVQASRRD